MAEHGEYVTLKVTTEDRDVLLKLIEAAPSLLASIEAAKQTSEMYEVFSEVKTALNAFIKAGNALQWIGKTFITIGIIIGGTWLVGKGVNHK